MDSRPLSMILISPTQLIHDLISYTILLKWLIISRLNFHTSQLIMDKAIKTLKRIAAISYNHKFKIIFIGGSLYGSYKLYQLYKYIKPLLELKNVFSGKPSSSQ